MIYRGDLDTAKILSEVTMFLLKVVYSNVTMLNRLSMLVNKFLHKNLLNRPPSLKTDGSLGDMLKEGKRQFKKMMYTVVNFTNI